jgi:lipoprotein-releasing system permease protein
MLHNASLFLALRYLQPKRSFVSIITIISVLGVSFGVAILIVVISVMAGFQQKMRDLAMGFESHIEMVDRWGGMNGTTSSTDADAPKVKNWHEVADELRKTLGITSVTPLVKGFLLVESDRGVVPSMMWGMEPAAATSLAAKHEKFVREGAIDLKGNTDGDKIVVDANLADAWGLKVGDKIKVFAPTNLDALRQTMREIDEKTSKAEKDEAYSKLKGIVLDQELTISGIFTPPHFQDSSDVFLMLVPLHVAQELRDMQGGISTLGVELADPYKADEFKNKLKKEMLPESWEAYSWIDQHAQLFATVENEMQMMYFVLFFIVIVAAFCVMNTMITVTVQKRRDIGIIAAIGGRAQQIMGVFVLQGLIVGILGSIVGLAMGLVVVWLRNDIRAGIAVATGREIFNANIYGILEIPAQVLPWNLFTICSGAFLLCTVAAFVPAWVAARVDPAVALRD